MSYNILADRLASTSKFSHTIKEVLDFNFRGPRIIEEIKQSQACIFCLQEVDRVNDFYKPKLEGLGLTLVHYKRPKFFQSDGIAIAYDGTQVFLLDIEYVDLNDCAKIYDNKTYNCNN